MLDIRFVRDNATRVKEFSAQKGYEVDVDAVLQLDEERRELQQKLMSCELDVTIFPHR